MTEQTFLQDAYARVGAGVVTEVTEGGVILDRTIFYAQGGGQPGDTGWVDWGAGDVAVTNAVKGDAGAIVLLLEGEARPEVGAKLRQRLDWERRFAHMRVHTGLHLLSVVVPLPVTGGAITAVKGRLDFNMPDAPEDKAALETQLNELIARDLPVTESWITDAELEANPGLVKTMSVQPPKGAGRVRLVRIGEGEAQVDLQPCGGTHVARTGEIGRVTIGKIEKKGAQNRRVNMLLG